MADRLDACMVVDVILPSLVRVSLAAKVYPWVGNYVIEVLVVFPG